MQNREKSKKTLYLSYINNKYPLKFDLYRNKFPALMK